MLQDRKPELNVFTLVWIVSALGGAAGCLLAFYFNWPMRRGIDWLYFVLVFGVSFGLLILSLMELFKKRKQLQVTAEGLIGLEEELIPWVIVQEIHFQVERHPAEMIVFRYDEEEARTYVLDKNDPSPEAIKAAVLRLAPWYAGVFR